MKRGKGYKNVVEKLDKTKEYTMNNAMTFIADNSLAKFDETVEIHLRLSIDPKKGDQQIRGNVILPHGTGKTTKVAVITESQEKEAKAAGADLVGSDDVIDLIKSGKFFEDKYDVIVASPEMMRKLAPVARILGPRGLMPSPKADTVTPKIKEAVEMLKKGKVSYKNDSNGNLHQAIGKLSFGAKKLEENGVAFLESINRSKPESVKGRLITSTSVCSTMGPSIKIVK